VEKFTAFWEVRSPHWHIRRQQVAQAFLNQFVRQNYAEIEEIPWEEHIVPVQLPAAERAIYLELDHFLQALDYNIKKSKAKVDNDRDRRQQEALGNSKTAEEALIKRCSHFDLDNAEHEEEDVKGKGKAAKGKAAKAKAAKEKAAEGKSVEKVVQENAVQACDFIVADRKKQLASCREDIRRTLRDALAQHEEIPQNEWQESSGTRSNDKRPRDLFMEFVNTCRTHGVGDPEANHDIRVLLDEAFAKRRGFKVTTIYSDGSVADPNISAPSVAPITKEGGQKGDGSANYTLDNFEKIDQLKSKVIYLRGLARKELAGRHRSLRYFTVVRDLQKSAIEKKVFEISCPGCRKQIVNASEIAVLSSCGHMGCYDCLEKAARLTKCLTDECGAATRALSVVRGDCLGSEDKLDGIGRHHGKKLEKIVELIMDRIPKEDKILLFVQFPDLMEKVARILTESGIKFFKIAGSGAKQSATVEAFQNDNSKDGVRVMLLNVTAESSSGA
jgi:SNF2 family DNA or RNA helicase